MSIGIRIEEFKVGNRTKEYFTAQFEAIPVILSPYTQYLIDKMTLSTEEKLARVIFPTGRDLGLTASAPYREFSRAGLTKGYELCDPEVGLYLRIHDSKQPVNNVYRMAMEPLAGRRGYPRVFALGHSSSGLWLRTSGARPGLLWDPGARLAFSLPASEPQKP